MLQFLIGSLDFRAVDSELITIDSCVMKAHDNLTFNVIGATIAHADLTFNMIGATIESPSQTPPLAYIKPRACGNKAELLRRNPHRV